MVNEIANDIITACDSRRSQSGECIFQVVASQGIQERIRLPDAFETRNLAGEEFISSTAELMLPTINHLSGMHNLLIRLGHNLPFSGVH